MTTYKLFPLDALPEPMRQMVQETAVATSTDPAYAALACLVTATSCIGNRVAAVVRDGWMEAAVLWGCLVGRSGTMKSPVLRLVARGAVELYKQNRTEYQSRLAEHASAVQRYAVELAEWKRQQRGKGAPVTDPPVEPEAPREKRLLVSDVTVEKLGALLEANPLGLLIVRDEVAALLGSFDRYANGRGDMPAYLSFHDAHSVVIDRKNEAGTLFVERAAVSILGGVQPAVLRRVFGERERESGLLARFLLVNPPERPQRWSDAGLSDDAAYCWRELLAALQGIPSAIDDNGYVRPHFIPLGDEAKALFIPWLNAHSDELAELADDDLRAHYSKQKGGCVRLALLFECIMAEGAIRFVGADAMRRAIILTEWYKHEAARIYGTLRDDAEQTRIRSMLEWIGRRGGSVTPTELARCGPREFRGDADMAEQALSLLVKAGFGRWENVGHGPDGGRPTLRFLLSPTGGEHAGGNGRDMEPPAADADGPPLPEPDFNPDEHEEIPLPY
ncbi:MAG: DUF3987 domain-containing protein [Phycisphaerae bacterium]|nr:DUF3987 domain-containing protein [Phycisphaerae bacterium]NUQ44739.1 DUF3987 domain-containing protein [Phycisphaerae bacterium]